MDEPEKFLNDWAKSIKTNSEIEYVEGLFQGAISGSTIVDKFSTWLLAGTGATAALMISNMDSLLSVMQPSSFKNSVYILVISSLFGFLEKLKSIQCHIAIESSDRIKSLVNSVIAKHNQEKEKIHKLADHHGLSIDAEIDFNLIMMEYKKAFPKIMRKSLTKQLNSGIKDRLSPSRNAANGFIWQSNYSLLQFVSFIAFVFLAISGIEYI